MRARIDQLVLIVATLVYCWLGMQAVHELGHVAAASAGGGTVGKVVLHPLTISRTDVSHDRHPLLVTWGGPVVGSLLPLAALVLMKWHRRRLFYMVQFFAGFCLIANGVYIGVGSFDGVGDAGDLLHFGAPPWTLIAFGLVAAPLGLSLWHGLGPYYGLGPTRADRLAVRWAVGIALFIVVVELIASGR